MSGPQPTNMEFHVGVTAHGQPVRLRYSTDYMGRGSWTIHRDAIDQRDNPTAVAGLTTDNIEQIAACVAASGRGRGSQARHCPDCTHAARCDGLQACHLEASPK